MKVQCNHKDKCDNPDCMDYNPHEPREERYNQVDSYCNLTSEICPIIMREVRCIEIQCPEVISSPHYDRCRLRDKQCEGYETCETYQDFINKLEEE
jgi:hypothetical protein